MAIFGRTLRECFERGTSGLLSQSAPHGKDSTCSPTSPYAATVTPQSRHSAPRPPGEEVSSLRRWQREPAGNGQGSWLVGLETSCLHVIAPPAVALSRCAEPRRRNPSLPNGWRWAIWQRQDNGQEPLIDEESPAMVREIDTPTVLILIDAELHELVWSCLWSQLQIARQIGRQSPGHVPAEDLSRAGALSATWLQHELARAFPERTALLEGNTDYNESDFQVDPADLFPSCQRASCVHQPDESAPLRNLARWFVGRVGAPESHYCPTHFHTWYAGDLLAGACHSTGDPGDHSEFNWDDVPTDHETDSLTEEMLLP